MLTSKTGSAVTAHTGKLPYVRPACQRTILSQLFRSIANWEMRETTSLRPDLIAELARVLDVSIEFLITGAEPNVRSKPGPKGQLEEAFEQAAKLPRSEQKQVLNVVTALIAQSTNK